jgi:hypothetical protein
MGIEPTAQAWEAWVLPLYDARLTRILVGFAVVAKPHRFLLRSRIPPHA